MLGEKTAESIAANVARQFDWRHPSTWVKALAGPLIGFVLLFQGPSNLRLPENLQSESVTKVVLLVVVDVLFGSFLWAVCLWLWSAVVVVFRRAQDMEQRRNEDVEPVPRPSPQHPPVSIDVDPYRLLDADEKAALNIFLGEGLHTLNFETLRRLSW